MAAEWTLAEIRKKVRQVSGRLSTNEMTTNQVDDYINKYYQFTFPAEVKLERKHTYYEFDTVANTHIYTLPNDPDNVSTPTVPAFTNFEPPATLDGLSLLWYQEPAPFLNNNPQDQVQRDNSNTGNAVITNFTVTATPTPILPATAIVTALTLGENNSETFIDTNEDYTEADVSLVSDGSGVGTVNYLTGVIDVNFAPNAPRQSTIIYFSWVPYRAGRPTAVLLYNNRFQFFTVPDTAYRFKVKAYSVVSPLENGTDKPDLEQWGPCIAYGAARQILADNGEMDAYMEVTSLYKEQLNYVLNRTNQTLLSTRAAPNF